MNEKQRVYRETPERRGRATLLGAHDSSDYIDWTKAERGGGKPQAVNDCDLATPLQLTLLEHIKVAANRA